MLHKNKIEKFYFKCAVCEGKSFLKIYGVSVFNVCLCEKCGLVCLNPRMDEKGYMGKFYQNYRYDLFGNYLDDDVDPDESYMKGEIEISTSQKLFNDLKNYLPQKAKILDVGCGAGEYLIFFKKNGFDNLVGLDPIPEYCQKLKNFYKISCYNQSLADFADRNEKFDCIILSHVIEHFVEPNRALEAISNLLADDGVLYLRTPDLYKFKNPFSQFCIPHTFYFSSGTLENLLKKNGFKVKRYFNNLFFPHEMILLVQKEKGYQEITYDSEEYKRVIRYLRKNKAYFVLFKLIRFIEEIFIKIFGENAYLKIRISLKNRAVSVIKKYRKFRNPK